MSDKLPRLSARVEVARRLCMSSPEPFSGTAFHNPLTAEMSAMSESVCEVRVLRSESRMEKNYPRVVQERFRTAPFRPSLSKSWRRSSSGFGTQNTDKKNEERNGNKIYDSDDSNFAERKRIEPNISQVMCCCISSPPGRLSSLQSCSVKNSVLLLPGSYDEKFSAFTVFLAR